MDLPKEQQNETNTSSKITSHSSIEDLDGFSSIDSVIKNKKFFSKNFTPKSIFFGIKLEEKKPSSPLEDIKEKSKRLSELLLSYYGNFGNYFENKDNSTTKNEEFLNLYPQKNIQVNHTSKDNFLFPKFIASTEDSEAKKIKKNPKPFPMKIKRDADLNSLVQLIETQQGCKHYQNQIIKNSEFANKILYPSLQPFMLRLMTDKFGNYLYQEFLGVLNENNISNFIGFISSNFRDLAYSCYGTRVIQKLLEQENFQGTIGKKIFEILSFHFRGNVPQLSMDDHANHIIKKFISVVEPEFLDFIFEEIFQSFTPIAKTKHGCCVIQKCLFHGNSGQKKKLIYFILQNTACLIKTQYGNYICQSLIFSSDDETILKFYEIISKDIISLCKEKYSSNVIEKLFLIQNKQLNNKLSHLILKKKTMILGLICSEFGNFIIQNIMECVTDMYIKEKVLKIIKENLKKIKSSYYGQKLLLNLEKKYSKFLSK